MSTECTRPGCSNPIPRNPKAKRPRLFCSNACRQKSYRQRHAPPEQRNNLSVTNWDQLMKVVSDMDIEQRQKLRQELDKQLGVQELKPPAESKSLTVDELQEQGGYIVYYHSPRSTVMHFSYQNQSYTLCRRKTEKMRVSYALPREAKVCQQCQGRYKEIRR